MVDTIDVAADGTLITLSNVAQDGLVDRHVEAAAARIAIAAARLLANEPALKGPDLKARIIALAKPFPEGAPKTARTGFIDDPGADIAYPATKPAIAN